MVYSGPFHKTLRKYPRIYSASDMAHIFGNQKPHIFLRNLVRDRTCGSVETIQELGGSPGIARAVNVNPSSGVASSEAEKRREEYGSNAPPEVETTSYWELLFEAFSDFTVIMLVAAAVVSLILAFAYEKTAGSYAEGFAILISVLIVTNVTAVNDYSKQKQFQRLNAAVEDVTVRCVRDGQVQDVRSAELVVGDIVQLAVGDMFAADGVLLQANNVSTDESALTGEPKLIRKDPKDAPFLLSGTKVMEGSGLFVVIAVGVNSEAGQIRELIRNKKKREKQKSPETNTAAASSPERENTSESQPQEGKEKSVLTAKLDMIAITVGKIATLIAVVALIVMCVKYAVLTFAKTDPSYVCAHISDALCSSQTVADFAKANSITVPPCPAQGSRVCCIDTNDGADILGAPCPWMSNHLGEFLQFIITAITILVVAVPEGLPLAVTLSLAFSVRKMQDEKNLVKHLDACETMGSATTICSDKTGTLTKNRMTVVKSMIGVNKGMSLASPDLPGAIKKSLVESICSAGNADIVWNPDLKLWDQIGSKTECALLQTVRDNLHHPHSYSQVRQEQEPRVVKRFPFSSAAKKSSFVIKQQGDSLMRIYTVGASEIVLGLCSHVVNTDGDKPQPMSQGNQTIVEKAIEEYAGQAMRTLCLAYKDVPAVINVDTISADENNQTLLCLVGIEDPLRDEVPLAIEKCNRAGVDVKMVTGDNLNTAIAIGKRCNIIRPSDLDSATGELSYNVAMTGPDFRRKVLDQDGNLIQSEIDKIWPFLRVLARSSPTDKYTLVTGMLASKLALSGGDRQVIAVTGDGTNDAPALKKADVGFAMGITGTAVARDAADIILMDDNFASIVVACKWGRNVFDSIQKFLQFQLTVNVVAVTIALEGAFIHNESPIGAVQMLWVNLIMDALASLALATEPPTDALLNRPPHGRSQSAISRIMVWNIVGQAMFQLLILNGIFFAGPTWFDIPSGIGNGHGAPPTVHYTMMFNALVMMQLTNQINSRKLYHEFNVFKGLFANYFFTCIIFVEAFLQVIFVQFGGSWVGTAALPGWLWGISIAISVGSFPVQWLIIVVRRIYLSYAGDKPTEKPKDTTQILTELVAMGPTRRTPPPAIDGDHPQPDARVSIVSPLPSARKLQNEFPLVPTNDVEAGAGGIRVSQSDRNMRSLAKQSSSNSLRAFSTKNLRDLVTAPDVETLQKSASGGFKNPTRQAATHQRFKKMSSFADASRGAEFVKAAREYQQSSNNQD